MPKGWWLGVRRFTQVGPSFTRNRVYPGDHLHLKEKRKKSPSTLKTNQNTAIPETLILQQEPQELQMQLHSQAGTERGHALRHQPIATFPLPRSASQAARSICWILLLSSLLRTCRPAAPYVIGEVHSKFCPVLYGLSVTYILNYHWQTEMTEIQN